jgi:hypothetical protein
MWDKLLQQASRFNNAVLNARDITGYPVSIRTPITADHEQHVLHLRVPDEAEVVSGPASLLFHDHDQNIWNQHVLLVRGEVLETAQGWDFRPLRLVPGIGMEGPLSMFRLIRDARRTTNTYLAKRGLARPHVSWERLRAVKHS